MPSNNPAQRLRDILENIAAIRAFVRSMTADDFPRDRKTVYGVTRALEITSEASRRLPPEMQARYPELDWAAIAAAGNVYRHEYEAVDESQLWRTATQGLDRLQEAIAAELERSEYR